MESLDLHGLSYEQAKTQATVFIENNLNNLPIQIITGNSVDMKKIVEEIISSHNLKSYPKTHYNLGCLVISEL